MIYSLDDIYYINRAVDLWLWSEDERTFDYEEDENNNERGITDD